MTENRKKNPINIYLSIYYYRVLYRISSIISSLFNKSISYNCISYDSKIFIIQFRYNSAFASVSLASFPDITNLVHSINGSRDQLGRSNLSDRVLAGVGSRWYWALLVCSTMCYIYTGYTTLYTHTIVHSIHTPYNVYPTLYVLYIHRIHHTVYTHYSPLNTHTIQCVCNTVCVIYIVISAYFTRATICRRCLSHKSVNLRFII